MTDIKNWAADAELNNEASPAGWPEGMPPSDVNNSARELMAAVRRSYVRQPWFAPGGAVARVSDTQITIIDDAKVTNYSAYYSVGGRARIEGGGSFVYGFIRQATYEAPTSTIEFTLDAEATLPAVITDVYVGLSPADIQGVAGPNLLGCILGYSSEENTIGAGLLLANGQKFNPNAYPDLANLYRISEGSYKYGQELVGNVYWPLTPVIKFSDIVSTTLNKRPPSWGSGSIKQIGSPFTATKDGVVAFELPTRMNGFIQVGAKRWNFDYRYNNTQNTLFSAPVKEGTTVSWSGLSNATFAEGTSVQELGHLSNLYGVVVAYGGVTAGGLADVSVVIEDTATAKSNSETAIATAGNAATTATAASVAANAAVLRVDGLESLIGDISGALDTINGEVV